MPFQRKSAAFCEGWQCVSTKQPCRYSSEQPKERADWARGFWAAVKAGQESKPWWRSKTVMVGVTLLAVGIIIWATGQNSQGGGGVFTSAGFGQGVSLSSLLMIFLRTISNDSITMTGSQYTEPPPYVGTTP